MKSLVSLEELGSKIQVEKLVFDNRGKTSSIVAERVVEKIGPVASRFIDFVKQKKKRFPITLHLSSQANCSISQRSEVLQNLQILLEYMSGGSRKLITAKKNLRVFSFASKALGFYLPNPTYRTASLFPGYLLQLEGPRTWV